MRRFDKITIIGVGLIGGSIGLAAKDKRLAKTIVGVFRRESTLNRALKRGAVDKGTLDLKSGVKGADLIVIATPVSSIPRIAREAIRYADRDAVITDAGSTKRSIIKEVEGVIGSRGAALFVGSHPMAGSEHAGVEFARKDLLEGSPCIVTKTPKTDARALKIVADFWKALGAKVTIMDPAGHDRSVALISHLPHIVAFGLAGAVPARELVYAAEGFKDTTRVASSDPRLWSDIFLTNKTEVLKALKLFEDYCRRLKRSLSKGKGQELIGLLAKAKSKRDKIVYGK